MIYGLIAIVVLVFVGIKMLNIVYGQMVRHFDLWKHYEFPLILQWHEIGCPTQFVNEHGDLAGDDVYIQQLETDGWELVPVLELRYFQRKWQYVMLWTYKHEKRKIYGVDKGFCRAYAIRQVLKLHTSIQSKVKRKE